MSEQKMGCLETTILDLESIRQFNTEHIDREDVDGWMDIISGLGVCPRPLLVYSEAGKNKYITEYELFPSYVNQCLYLALFQLSIEGEHVDRATFVVGSNYEDTKIAAVFYEEGDE